MRSMTGTYDKWQSIDYRGKKPKNINESFKYSGQ